ESAGGDQRGAVDDQGHALPDELLPGLQDRRSGKARRAAALIDVDRVAGRRGSGGGGQRAERRRRLPVTRRAVVLHVPDPPGQVEGHRGGRGGDGRAAAGVAGDRVREGIAGRGRAAGIRLRRVAERPVGRDGHAAAGRRGDGPGGRRDTTVWQIVGRETRGRADERCCRAGRGTARDDELRVVDQAV